jgi:putative FmdB family regulatory protein
MPVYEYECRSCESKFEEYATKPHDGMVFQCPRCGDLGDRVYSLSVPKVFETFTTRNILPDGEPVTVRGTGQLRQLEAEHKVKLADADAGPPQTIHP